jgi:SNF2 family DNA or RNA helicase
MQPAVRFKREECLLGTTISDHHTEMTDAQTRVFNDLKNKMYHEDRETEITAVNAAVKLIKLQQVMCGVVKDDEGNPVELAPTKRLNDMLDLIKHADAKSVVFVPFKASMYMIQNFLASKGISSAVINGDVGKTERERIIYEFTNSVEPHVLIAHPKVAAHGLDLTVADVFIWFAPTFSTLQYEQANARGEGPKKTRPIGIYHMGCHPVEWAIYEVLKGKVSMQSKMLDLYDSVFN